MNGRGGGGAARGTYAHADTVCHGSIVGGSYARAGSAIQTPFRLRHRGLSPNYTFLVYVQHVPRLARQPYVRLHEKNIPHLSVSYKNVGPNAVLEQQRAFQVSRCQTFDSLVTYPPTSFQSSHLPIYMRPPRARLYLGTHPLCSCSKRLVHTVRHRDLL